MSNETLVARQPLNGARSTHPIESLVHKSIERVFDDIVKMQDHYDLSRITVRLYPDKKNRSIDAVASAELKILICRSASTAE